MVRLHFFVCLGFVTLLSYFPLANAAQDTAAITSDSEPVVSRIGMLDDPQDPENQLVMIQQRRLEKNSLFKASPLKEFREETNQWKDSLYKEEGIKLGLAFTTLFQTLTDVLPGEDKSGVASDLDLYATWELVERGKPNQGQVFLQIEGRWDYGTTGPDDLGPAGLGSLGFTSNTYSAYTPTFLPVRNLYWQQGSKKAGWLYRFGKITPDATLQTSRHISAVITFLPVVGTGGFTNALPDSGLGVMGTWHLSDRFGLLGVVSDANADRQNLGDISAGDFYKAIELGAKIAPRTPESGYSKFTLWHTDGTKDGLPSNGMTGPEGWGYFVKLEQELSADGKSIGLFRYGKSYNESALYRQQSGVHWLLYDPHFFGSIRNDLLGTAFNWVEATASVRDEYNFELFYRFPFIPHVDTTLSYQAIFDPALDLGIDFTNVFSIRIRTTF